MSTDVGLPAVQAAFAELRAGGDGWVRIANAEGAITVERLSARWGAQRRAVVAHPGELAEVYWDVPLDERRRVVVTAEVSADSTVRWLRLVAYSP